MELQKIISRSSVPSHDDDKGTYLDTPIRPSLNFITGINESLNTGGVNV